MTKSMKTKCDIIATGIVYDNQIAAVIYESVYTSPSQGLH
jgi:hypothetical protein